MKGEGPRFETGWGHSATPRVVPFSNSHSADPLMCVYILVIQTHLMVSMRKLDSWGGTPWEITPYWLGTCAGDRSWSLNVVLFGSKPGTHTSPVPTTVAAQLQTTRHIGQNGLRQGIAECSHPASNRGLSPSNGSIRVTL